MGRQQFERRSVRQHPAQVQRIQFETLDQERGFVQCAKDDVDVRKVGGRDRSGEGACRGLRNQRRVQQHLQERLSAQAGFGQQQLRLVGGEAQRGGDLSSNDARPVLAGVGAQCFAQRTYVLGDDLFAQALSGIGAASEEVVEFIDGERRLRHPVDALDEIHRRLGCCEDICHAGQSFEREQILDRDCQPLGQPCIAADAGQIGDAEVVVRQPGLHALEVCGGDGERREHGPAVVRIGVGDVHAGCDRQRERRIHRIDHAILKKVVVQRRYGLLRLISLDARLGVDVGKEGQYSVDRQAQTLLQRRELLQTDEAGLVQFAGADLRRADQQVQFPDGPTGVPTQTQEAVDLVETRRIQVSDHLQFGVAGRLRPFDDHVVRVVERVDPLHVQEIEQLVVSQEGATQEIGDAPLGRDARPSEAPIDDLLCVGVVGRCEDDGRLVRRHAPVLGGNAGVGRRRESRLRLIGLHQLPARNAQVLQKDPCLLLPKVEGHGQRKVGRAQLVVRDLAHVLGRGP